MLKIRLMRIGAKKKPFYRVVAVAERSKRTGGYLELLGTYNPLTEPKDIKINQERVDHWIKQGAQMSVGFLRIIGKAPQRLPRKAKKEKKVETPAPAPAAETPAGETAPGAPAQEVPAEEITKPETVQETAAPEETPTPEPVVEEAKAEEAPTETPAEQAETPAKPIKAEEK